MQDERIIQHTPIHFSLQGRAYKVSFFPTTGNFYIVGAKKINDECKYNNIQEVIDIADGKRELPAISNNRDKRKRTYTKEKKLLYTQDKACCYCHKELELSDATIEHKIPLSKGGNNKIENLSLACKECNQAKGDSIKIDVTQKPVPANPLFPFLQ